MKYFSMFSGIGGFELGIQNAYRGALRGEQKDTQGDQGQRLLPSQGQDFSTQDRRAGERSTDILDKRPLCVGYSEIDKYAIKVYERHFNHDNYGDATTINPDTLPDFELLVGGFPCQAFSVAGKRAGFNDTRGTLFFDIARILKVKRPRHLVLENVKGLLSHDSGKTFQTILGVLTDLGYDVEWQVLNSKDFGVPQNRERIFIVGHLGRECTGKVFPITGQGNKNTTLGKSTKTAVARTLTAGGHSGGNHSGMTIISKTVRAGGRGSPHGSKQNWDSYEHEGRIRRLTPKECERLQAYPDDWTKYGIGDELISDTQRYKMCGNGVTVNVVQAVMERLFNHDSQ